MRILIATLALLVAAAPASAISRYNAWTMSCGEVQSRVKEEGAVILRSRSQRDPTLPLYGRFVSSSNYCAAGERVEFGYLRTTDTDSCAVRSCEPYDPLPGR